MFTSLHICMDFSICRVFDDIRVAFILKRARACLLIDIDEYSILFDL
jgi:hypothetical protein